LKQAAEKAKSGVVERAPPSPTVVQSQGQVVPSVRAQRRIGNYYDELVKGMNPFGFVPTYSVVDASTPASEIRALFDQFGVVKVRGVYSPEYSEKLNKLCVSFSKLNPLDLRNVFTGASKGFAGGAPVLNERGFWPYASNKYVLDAILAILGDQAFEFGSSVAAHYAARGLHRDYRQLCEKEGSSYNIANPERRVVRVLHYCAAKHMHGGMLGIIPFSHDERKFAAQGARIGMKRPTSWFDRHREVLIEARTSKNFAEVDEIDRHIVWISTDPGDVLITNSAMLHCGEHITMPRYFFVSTYAEANEETLPYAVPMVTTPLAESYQAFMDSVGFKGNGEILRRVKENA
jgi:hypothetical protein